MRKDVIARLKAEESRVVEHTGGGEHRPVANDAVRMTELRQRVDDKKAQGFVSTRLR